MSDDTEIVTIQIQGIDAEPGKVSAGAVGRVLTAVHDLNRTAFEIAKWGNVKRGALSDQDRLLSTISYSETRQGSVIVDLLAPLLAQQPSLFGDLPITSIPQIWIQAIKYLLEKTKGMIGQLALPGLQVSPTINIHESHAPIIIQTSYSGHNNIQDLVRPIRPGSIDSVSIGLPRTRDFELSLGSTERELLLRSSVSVAPDSYFVGSLIRFDIRRLNGLVEILDGTGVLCDFVFPEADQLKHLMNELCRFTGRPHYVQALGERSLCKYTVLRVKPLQKGSREDSPMSP